MGLILKAMTSSPYPDILLRIEAALVAARTVFDRFTPVAPLQRNTKPGTTR